MKTAPAQKLRYPKPNDERKGAPRPKAPNNSIGGLITQALTKSAPGCNKLQVFKQLALDTETTGVDLWHGCKPFFVSTCDEHGELRFWEWDVNPWTREVGYWTKGMVEPRSPGRPTSAQQLKQNLKNDAQRSKFINGPPANELKELKRLLELHYFILHNTKFDARALETLGLPRLNMSTAQDTLIASHCLVSNESHKLKDLALQYLNINDDDQSDLREATNEARSIGRSLDWAIARDGGHPHFPAQRHAPKEGWWVFDTWLPRAVARYYWEVEGDDNWAPPPDSELWESSDYVPDESFPGHPWWTVLSTYATRDVERTYGLWWLQLDALEKEGLLEQYEEKRKNVEVLYEMEHHGVTISKKRLSEMNKKISKESDEMHDRCLEIADYKIDNLASSRQLEGVLFGNFKIHPGKMTKAAIEGNRNGQQYSTGNEVLLKLLDRTDGKHREFVWKLLGYRAREKSKTYLEEYTLRGMPAGTGWLTLHTSLNPTGTDTTRLSSSGPNIQNVGKGGKRKDDPIPSLRSIFGAKPGREWYSIDYSNIEMRIFAYKSGDKQLINAFESGYSVHLIFAEILYPEEWSLCRSEVFHQLQQTDPNFSKFKSSASIKNPALLEILRRKTGSLFKSKFEATFYQWCKNGNFALIYGAGQERADTTYHVSGAYDLIRTHLPLIDQFMQQKNHEARSYGYVTLESGYRLYVPPSEPHVAVNYYVQGNAGWCMVLALNRAHDYLKSLNRDLSQSAAKVREIMATYRMTMTIHDELDFDFPKHERNHRVISKIARIMESSGNAIGVPTTVEIERHPDNWSIGEKVEQLTV